MTTLQKSAVEAFSTTITMAASDVEQSIDNAIETVLN